MFKLVICDDEGKTTIVPLIRDEVLIGRQEGNTIRLTDRNVSRNHARIVRKNEDVFSVEDLGSRNGTKINSNLITVEPMPVTAGDLIYIGDYNLSVRTDVSADLPMGKQINSEDGAGIGKVTTYARLVLISGKEAGKEFDLAVNLYVVGRSEEANLRVNDPSISRAHARLDGNNHQWTISDLDSITGIVINGQKRDNYLLKSGDVVELGTVKLRFVPPGEPYEFTVETEEIVASKTKRSSKLVLIFGGVGAVMILALILAFIGSYDDGGDNRENDDQVSDDALIEQIIEKGKDHVQSEEWADAARLFAEAQLLDPTRKNIKELKSNSIFEMESQEKYLAALEAEKNENWPKALNALSQITRSSHYYDIDMLQSIAGKLCKELLDKANFMATSGNLADAKQTLEEIKGIAEAPDFCEEQRSELEKLFGKKVENHPLKNVLKSADRSSTSGASMNFEISDVLDEEKNENTHLLKKEIPTQPSEPKPKPAFVPSESPADLSDSGTP